MWRVLDGHRRYAAGLLYHGEAFLIKAVAMSDAEGLVKTAMKVLNTTVNKRTRAPRACYFDLGRIEKRASKVGHSIRPWAS